METTDDTDNFLNELDDDHVDEEQKSEPAVEEDEENNIDIEFKRKRKRMDKKAKASTRKKIQRYNFFNEEAEVADSDDEEEEYETAEREEILDKDHLEAIARVEKRHTVNRDFQRRSADELVADIERRHQYQEQFKQQFEENDGFLGQQATPVAQQALLPSYKDPKLFKIKCKMGCEQIMIRAIMLKAIDVHNRQMDFYKVKSAFCGTSKGYIYVEAISEAFARELLSGLKMIYLNSFQQVPIEEMTSVLSVTLSKKPLKPGDFVRIKRGVLKGDLARIIDLFDGESKALIQAIPRVVYNADEAAIGTEKSKIHFSTDSSRTNKVRPPQAFFDPELATASNNGYVFRRHHPLDPSAALYDVWNGEYYKDGFLFKEVNVQTYIDNESQTKPKLEELKAFMDGKRSSVEDEREDWNEKDDKEDDLKDKLNSDDEDEEAEKPVQRISTVISSMNTELAKTISQLAGEEESLQMSPFVAGDIVRVTGGEMVNLIGRVLSINDVTKTALLRPYNNVVLTGEFDVELSLLVKYVEPGAHVKVMTGRYAGTTGRVVAVTGEANGQDQLAIILTDGSNTQITCNVSTLQISDEVATGMGNLMGYELYDLVALNENESAVVIKVGTEKLKVINHLSDVKDVVPQEIRAKLNGVSQRSKTLDSASNSIAVGDTVHVISGNHAKLSGTIKHINKGTIWLHSNHYFKNSGVFVVKGRNCALAGVRSDTAANTFAHPSSFGQGSRYNSGGGVGSQQSTPTLGFVSRSPHGSGGRGGGRGGMGESNIGKTIRVTKGKYKGKLGQVVDETTTHFQVEILSMFKKDMVKKADAIVVGDKEGSFDRQRQGPGGSTAVTSELPEYSIAAATPYLSASTPMHVLGSETPMIFGNETPYLGVANNGDDLDRESAWKVTDADRSAQYGTSINYPDQSSHYSRTTTPAMTMTPASTATPFSSYPSSSSAAPFASPAGISSSNDRRDNTEVEQTVFNNMVVVIKKGKHIGRMAVVLEHNLETNQVHLRLRDGQGRLQGDDIFLATDSFTSADPSKNATVYVVKGSHKGRVGTVKSVMGKSDLLIDFENGVESEVLKKQMVVWLNDSAN